MASVEHAGARAHHHRSQVRPEAVGHAHVTDPGRIDDRRGRVAAGGDDTHPAWFLNLRDNPDVEVSYKGGPLQKMRARVATADERARLWPLVIVDHKNYAGYQTKTTREIPLVLLEPAPES